MFQINSTSVPLTYKNVLFVIAKTRDLYKFAYCFSSIVLYVMQAQNMFSEGLVKYTHFFRAYFYIFYDFMIEVIIGIIMALLFVFAFFIQQFVYFIFSKII